MKGKSRWKSCNPYVVRRSVFEACVNFFYAVAWICNHLYILNSYIHIYFI
jgi:hypothetical protein